MRFMRGPSLAIGGLDVEVIDVNVETLLLRRGRPRSEPPNAEPSRSPAPALVGEGDDVDRLLDALALDEVEHELGLLRAGALELCLGAELGICWAAVLAMIFIP